MDKEQAISKIRKLQALAQCSGASTGEVDNALRQADALMRKHAIEASEIALAGQTYQWSTIAIPTGKDIPEWQGILAVGIAKFTDTIVNGRVDVDKSWRLEYFGEASDIPFAEWLHHYLIQIINGHTQNQPLQARPQYRRIFAARLQQRLIELRLKRDTVDAVDMPVNAIVCIGNKLTALHQKASTPTQEVKVDANNKAGKQAIKEADKVNFNRPLQSAAKHATISNQRRINHV